MPVSEGYREYVMGRLERVGQVTARNMFGGVGIYFEGLFCALIAENVLYFKVDDANGWTMRQRVWGLSGPAGRQCSFTRYRRRCWMMTRSCGYGRTKRWM